MITKETLQQWVEALESGKYPQSTKRLRNNEGFCCLGVLCDILQPDHWEKVCVGTFLHPLEAKDESMPNENICKELHNLGVNAQSLASLNDNGSTFPEIANIIKLEAKL